MRFLKTNSACIVTVGPFFDRTDGVTIETALTITNERISFTVDANDGSAPTLVLDNVTGATSGTANDLNYITNCDAGLMQLELAAANVNYLGRAFLTITDAANHCPVFHEFMILPAVVYDAMVAGTDLFDVSITQILGTAVSTPATAGILDINLKNIANAAVSTTSAQLGVNVVQLSGDGTAADNAEAFFDGTGYAGTNNVIPTVTSVTSIAANGITATSIATDAINAASVKADAVTKIQTGLATPTNITAGTITTVTNLTNAPTAGDLTATMKTSVTTSATAATPIAAAVTGAVGSVTGAVGSVATGGITSASFATGAITATAIAADAIGASELAADAVTEIANALAALTVDTGMTLQNAMKLVLAAAAGKVSGAAGTTVTIRDTTDTYDRIVATVDASGNRTALTYVTT